MKNKVFKRLKANAVEYLSKFPVEVYNRYTKEDLQKALGKDTLTYENKELETLLKWVFDTCQPIKFNLEYHVFDIQLLRSKEDGVYRNAIITRPKFVAQRLNLRRHLTEYRIAMLQEIEVMIEIHNTLCSIFQFGEVDEPDHTPSIKEIPDFGFTDSIEDYVWEFGDEVWLKTPLTKKEEDEMYSEECQRRAHTQATAGPEGRIKGSTIPF